MHILAAGLNYRTAPVEIREKFAISAAELPLALGQLKQTKCVQECVIVVTCNRTEIYMVVDGMNVCGNIIPSFMEKWFGVPRADFNSHLYIKEDLDAVSHLFRVASGLDSMIIGETQILGQVRDAFLLAQKEQATGTLFNMLFKQAVTLAKRAHSETSIGENAVSVSYAAVELGKRIFGSFQDKTVMIIGAGKMSELTAKHLHANGADRVWVVNRTHEKAVELAEKFNGTARPYAQLLADLAETDIVISSTGATGLVLTRQQVETAMARRASRPLFMIDIAVPRDLDPAIGGLPNVFSYDIDDLETMVEQNVAERRKEAERIEDMISAEVTAYEQWYKTLGVAPVIHALQVKSNAIHEETMESLLKKLPDLDEREIKVIRKLTKSIVNQMLRDPIVRIKEMSAERRGDEALEMFTKFFALDELLEQEAAVTEERAVRQAEPSEPAASKDNKLSALLLQGKELLAGS